MIGLAGGRVEQSGWVLLPLCPALDVAVAEFGSRLSNVSDADWGSPTPCTDWDVRYLVAHVVGGNRFAALVLDGMSSDGALERIMSEPQLGTSPIRDFEQSASVQRRLFARPGLGAATVSHPLGDLPGERFLRMRVFDIALHAWDLASAIGADQTLDRDLVETVLGIVEEEPVAMSFGMAAVGEVEPGVSSQKLLLDLTGRRSG